MIKQRFLTSNVQLTAEVNVESLSLCRLALHAHTALRISRSVPPKSLANTLGPDSAAETVKVKKYFPLADWFPLPRMIAPRNWKAYLLLKESVWSIAGALSQGRIQGAIVPIKTTKVTLFTILNNSENNLRDIRPFCRPLFCHSSPVKYILHLYYSSEAAMRFDYQILLKFPPPNLPGWIRPCPFGWLGNNVCHLPSFPEVTYTVWFVASLFQWAAKTGLPECPLTAAAPHLTLSHVYKILESFSVQCFLKKVFIHWANVRFSEH